MLKYKDCFQKAELYYWQHHSKNGNAEVDYLEARNANVLPVEVKASTQGAMQSLYFFMREKHLRNAVRTSLENFGTFEYTDQKDNNAVRHIEICPLYALSWLYE